jgi:hypothetical protein
VKRTPPSFATGTSAVQRLRPWLMPALAVVVVIALFGRGGFDVEQVRAELRAGDVDDALRRLASAPQVDLPEAVRLLHWWTRADRTQALALLATRPEPELLEAAGLPTFVAPLGLWREPPARIVLREPADRPLLVELLNVTLNLPVATLAIAAGQQQVPCRGSFIAGTRYALALHDGSGTDAPVVAVADFTLASADDARAVTAVLDAARALGPPDHPGARLLAGNAALECNCTDEALVVFRELATLPGDEHAELRRAARELAAITLDRQGLDVSARRELEGAP